MARKIQTIIRGFLARRKLKKLKKGKQDYEDLMDKLERDVRCWVFFIRCVKKASISKLLEGF